MEKLLCEPASHLLGLGSFRRIVNLAQRTMLCDAPQVGLHGQSSPNAVGIAASACKQISAYVDMCVGRSD
ncbi:MAG: hypothetical protein HY314_11535 [Acidobacteria bacterium]|nr:hypothetical protein [Acidobacteriota bacterium]